MSEKYYQRYGPIQRRRTKRSSYDDPPPENTPDPERPRTQKRPPRRGVRALAILITIVLGVAAGLALPFVPSVVAAEQPLPRVTLHGASVDALDRAAIRASLRARYNDFMRTPVTLVYREQLWTPTLTDLGVRLDLDAAADSALMFGRRGGLFQRIDDLSMLGRGGIDLAPTLTVDGPTLQTYLLTLAISIDVAPRDAALGVVADRVAVGAAQTGTQLLIDETTIDILRALTSLTPQTVALRSRALSPAIDDATAVQAAAAARTMLAGPLTLRHDTRNWTWEAARVAEMLNFTRRDGTLVVEPDLERLARATEQLAQTVDSPSAEPRVAFRDGRATIIAEGREGVRLKQAEATAQIAEAIRSGARDVALPVERIVPQVTAASLPSLGIVELVSEGKSSYRGSAPYRVTNIEAGATRMNGVLIAPGAEFSFNTQLGAVDESNGFVQGYAVIGNRTQLEWGGGVCQVSTTVFRTAFWSGMPITERHAHPFYIRWYDEYSFPTAAAPGMDATIYTGVLDLKFVNDSAHWLLMEADASGEVLTIRLYGTRVAGRSVRAVGPEIDNVTAAPTAPVYVDDAAVPSGTVRQTDTARKGMDITVYRVVSDGGVEREPEVFFTRFKAWPDVFVRGTG